MVWKSLYSGVSVYIHDNARAELCQWGRKGSKKISFSPLRGERISGPPGLVSGAVRESVFVWMGFSPTIKLSGCSFSFKSDRFSTNQNVTPFVRGDANAEASFLVEDAFGGDFLCFDAALYALDEAYAVGIVRATLDLVTEVLGVGGERPRNEGAFAVPKKPVEGGCFGCLRQSDDEG